MSAPDVSAQFRRGRAGTQAEEAEQYAAFKAVDRRQLRLDIITARPVWESLTYGNYLLRIVQDGAHGTQLVLVYTFMAVVIRGRNLLPIAEAIKTEQCAEIREFDRTRWPEPTDASAPFIASITFLRAGLGEELAALAATD